MIDGPHIFGFSPVALCISLTSTLASARLLWSVSASMNAATLALVGLALLSAIRRALPSFVGAPLYQSGQPTAYVPVDASALSDARFGEALRQPRRSSRLR